MAFPHSFTLAAIFVQPWRITSWPDGGMMAVMLVVVALWVAGGLLIGAIAALITLAVARRLAALLRR